jgi:23S rRNA pseudouridine1911/1915/1917 synthase
LDAVGIFGRERDLTEAPREIELRVDASAWQRPHDSFEIRLDSFLARHLSWRSRTSLQELVRDGHVLVDPSSPDRPRGSGSAHEERRPGRKLRHGSRVVVVIPEELRRPMSGPTRGELTVLYEDRCIVAVDKPALVTVHPSGRHLTDTLIQRVHAVYGAGFELEREGAPRLCHRLDRETSGVVLCALDRAAHADVQQQFERREVGKEYLAIVHGVPERDAGVVDLPIGPARASSVGVKMAVAVDGQTCRTEWRVVERAERWALVSCAPLTGRQHQIRVHMAAIGHPLVGDKLYGEDELLFERGLDGTLTAADQAELGLARHALHNHRVVFRTPASGATVEVVSPLPADLRDWLRAHGGARRT